MKFFYLLFSFWALNSSVYAGGARPFLERGWRELVIDHDVAALKNFGLAYEKASIEKDTTDLAFSLLYMGICSYSVSYSEGMEYAIRAMDEFKKFEGIDSDMALEGRSRCLQLISTIHGRQGKYREAIALSTEARNGFTSGKDTTGYLGLIYTSLGVAYSHLNAIDSSDYFHRMALDEWLKTNTVVYLPTAYQNVADIELRNHQKEKSRMYYDRALCIADSTGNRQAQVASWLGLANWWLTFEKNETETESCYTKAKVIADQLSDKSYVLKTLDQWIRFKKYQNNFKQALAFEEEGKAMRDTIYSLDKQKAIKKLEIQFDVSEKDRQLKLALKENEISRLTNYMLWGTIGFLLLISIGIIVFLKRINIRDKVLIKTKEELVQAVEEQKRLKEYQMQNELEFKESQLTAMTLQMFQKNELMQELKGRLEENKDKEVEVVLKNIINKGQNQDKDWSDFNNSFESLNKNFYTRLKQAYPEISPNDLKICALIKLNLSIKEMAGILNISPDSVKTARYRLRKKLQLNTEDNLTEFILRL